MLFPFFLDNDLYFFILGVNAQIFNSTVEITIPAGNKLMMQQ